MRDNPIFIRIQRVKHIVDRQNICQCIDGRFFFDFTDQSLNLDRSFELMIGSAMEFNQNLHFLEIIVVFHEAHRFLSMRRNDYFLRNYLNKRSLAASCLLQVFTILSNLSFAAPNKMTGLDFNEGRLFIMIVMKIGFVNQ